jgi:hypothetical protein
MGCVLHLCELASSLLGNSEERRGERRALTFFLLKTGSQRSPQATSLGFRRGAARVAGPIMTLRSTTSAVAVAAGGRHGMDAYHMGRFLNLVLHYSPSYPYTRSLVAKQGKNHNKSN